MNNLTYVWIAIAVIGWIYKTLKKSKQNQTQANPKFNEQEHSPAQYSTPAPQKELNIDDLLKSITEKESFTEYNTPVVEKLPEIEKPVPFKKKEEKIMEVESELEFERYNVYELDNNQENNSLRWANKLQSTDGAREAFIMSEIFSKKY